MNEKHTANVDSDRVETAISKYQILVIDDSHATRRGVKKFLEPLNMEIAEASDGQQGLELAKNGEFDLIITDIDMPKMNGIELCRRLKNTQDTRTIPVIMLSSFDSEADINRGFQAGAAAYISKKKRVSVCKSQSKKSCQKLSSSGSVSSW